MPPILFRPDNSTFPEVYVKLSWHNGYFIHEYCDASPVEGFELDEHKLILYRGNEEIYKGSPGIKDKVFEQDLVEVWNGKFVNSFDMKDESSIFIHESEAGAEGSSRNDLTLFDNKFNMTIVYADDLAVDINNDLYALNAIKNTLDLSIHCGNGLPCQL